MKRIAWSVISAFVSATATAAPLDALLESSPQTQHGSGYVEIAADSMNKTLDVFNVRQSSGLNISDNTGDYRGQHLRGGFSPAADYWIDGAFYQRRLTYGVDQPQYNSWQLGGQWRFKAASDQGPEASVRLSAWGNRADSVSRTTSMPVEIQGVPITLEKLTVHQPQDHQLQADLIGTYRWPSVTSSIFAGVGMGQVRVNGVSVQALGMTIDGNNPLMTLLPASYQQQLAALNYDTRYVHLGANARYTTGAWTLRGGYDLFAIHRSQIDELIAQQAAPNNQSYKLNHTFVGELSYRLTRSVQLFGRGQLMLNQFLSDTPFLYNSITAKRFNQKYGVASFGVALNF